MSQHEQSDKSNTPRTDIIAGLWGGGDATIRRQLRRMEDHARQLENELSLAERRLATSEKCRNNLAASIPSSIGLTPKEGHCLLQVPQQTTEKPSPCAMAGYCLNTDAKAMPSATGRTLEEALHRCADYHGDDALLDAPCIFCGYNGAGYWQKGTHSKDCRLSDVGGFDDRRKALLRREQSDISNTSLEQP